MHSSRLISRRDALHRLAAGTALAAALTPSRACAARKLDDPFDRLVRSEGFTDDGPGLAVLAQQRGQPAFMRCVGLATLKDRMPVTPQTMFELASVSKTMTATAVLMLQEQEKLRISDDVRKFIPELPEYNKRQPIRIQDLLQHTSGLASYFDIQDVPQKNEGYWVNADYVGEFARQNIPLDFPTGQKHAYNNTNYLLAAVVIAFG